MALTKAAERELKRQFREASRKSSMWPASGGIHPPQKVGGSAADLRLAKPPETESLLQTGKPAQTEYEVVEYAADNTQEWC